MFCYTRRRHLPSSNCEFFENRCRESRALLRSVNDCCPHLFHLLSYLGETRGKRPALITVAHSRFSWKSTQGRPWFFFFLIGVHGISLSLVPLNCSTFESKERLVKVCVLRHTFALLLCCATLCRCKFVKRPAVRLFPVGCESAVKCIDCHSSILYTWRDNEGTRTKLRGLSPRANYTDRAAAAGRRSSANFCG